MRIERVIIKGLRALRSRDDSFKTPAGGIYEAICLRGLTGSGKTTYLEVLAQLWQWFRRCTQRRGYEKPIATALLAEAELVAALFTDLPGPMPRMWLAVGTAEAVAAAIGKDAECPYTFHRNRINWEDEHLLEYWDAAMARAEAGVTETAPPNMVWLEAENKYVPALRGHELTESRPAPVFVPVARYLPSARGPSHLEGIMRALFLTRPEQWKVLATRVHELRPNLTLVDRFEESSQRPLFQLPSGEFINAERLSAGERSLLINLCMLLRWLSPGGIAMIDEPELHQHLSLMRGSLSILADLVATKFKGQLLIASHAPEVWDHMRLAGTFLDLES